MEITPQIFTATVTHKRLFPTINRFTYGIYYLALPLSLLNSPDTQKYLAVNRFGILSFFEKDHGNRQDQCEEWIRKVLAEHCLIEWVEEIFLISMPRVLGYVFNPVSFWLCLDNQQRLRAVLCEVNNTFGETHSYLCADEKGKVIKDSDWLEAKKVFHVSPFLERHGKYQFRFSLKEQQLSIWIDFYDPNGKKKLITSLVGDLQPLTKNALRWVILKYPLITLKTIFLIHWQAVKLISKGIRYLPKPTPIKDKLSLSHKVKSMKENS